MLKARLAIPFLAIVPLLAACGAEVTVRVLMDGAEEPQPVEDHEIQFLPFDRDSLFATLTAEASEPEPQVTADLRQAYDSVQVLQEEWRTAEDAWNVARDSLRSINERLQGMDPRGREYRELFDRFGSLESRERALNRQRQAAFEAFTSLQQATQVRLDSISAVIESWENEAFADYVDIETALLSELGREIVIDTTGADGYLTRTLPGGIWWIHTRVAVPSGELYWNLQTDVGAVDTVRLTPDNAERRLVF